MMSQYGNYNIKQYTKDILDWCELNSITSFYQSDLPEDLRTTTGGMLRAASSRGYFRRGKKDSKSRVSEWHVIPRSV